MIVQLLFTMFLFMSSANAGVADRIVVIVDRDLVMASDVRLEEVVSGLDTSNHPYWQRDRGTALERLIDAAIIRKLAGTVSLYQPPPARINERLQALRSRFGPLEAWQSFLTFWGLDEVSFVRMVRRRMIVEMYLNRNLQSTGPEADDWEQQYQAFMTQIRSRFRIRHVPESP